MGSKIPKENMIPLGKDAEHDAKIRAKLKGTASKKRELAQQVRRAKEKVEQGNGEVDEITRLISDPDASAKQIQDMIQQASQMSLKPMEFIALIRTVTEKHKILFGTKNYNANLNMNMSITDDMIARLKQYKGRKIESLTSAPKLIEKEQQLIKINIDKKELDEEEEL